MPAPPRTGRLIPSPRVARDRSPIPVTWTVPDPPGVDDQSPAEQLPMLYRSILDGVARLERAGDRRAAGQIRTDATRAYSKAWDEPNRRRLEQLLQRLDRVLAAHPPVPERPARGLGTGVLSQHPTG